ncbi:patatin-like phospholipase family protein [Streptomyces sp. SRF1]|uniref:patatin-like phospholipase family protein n=1 Tax=Streptomyces sp. SRF1 TaxID=1549642 RepID=UPI0025AF7512|nr:patatin-like phospholipase family protein [Streptomyces sp. SRF1]MDN3058988.1 patatin-like phospholipase family protein [Streptomyces sp. SRF1]
MPPTRALVLGGGGVTGIAWETGFLAGMAEHGLELAAADIIVGTSAGATVAAQVTSGVPIEDLMAAQLDPRAGVEPILDVDLRAVLGEIDRLLASSADPLEARRRVGRFALEARVPEEAARLEIIRRRLPGHDWPSAHLVITAVDTTSGEFVTLDRNSGLGLAETVAASCAIPGVWPAVTWGDRRLMDGGIRTGTNADVAVGHDRVLVLEPFGRADPPPDVTPLPRNAVMVVEPDAHYREVAVNALDASARPRAAEVGRAHARRIAKDVERFWRASEDHRTNRAPTGAVGKGPRTAPW